MARTFTITQEGESREFTVATGVGPSGVDGVDAEVTLAAVRAAVPNMVEVAAPAENDFIQRGPSGWLTKTIEQVKTALGLGTAAYTASTNYASALGTDDNYVTDAEKTKLGNLSGTNTGDQDLSGAISAHAIATDPHGDRAYADGLVKHIDLFVVVGQSNSYGYGGNYTTASTPGARALLWKTSGVSGISVVQGITGGEEIGSSLVPSFSASYEANGGGAACYMIGVGIDGAAMAAAADGGSGNFDTSGALRATVVTRVNLAKADLVSAGYTVKSTRILLLQGEQDAEKIRLATITKATYKTALQTFLAYLRTSLGAKTEVCIVRTGIRTSVADTGGLQVRQAQEEVAYSDNLTFISGRGTYDFPNTSRMADTVHYNQAGQNYLGEIACNSFFGKGEDLTLKAVFDGNEAVSGSYGEVVTNAVAQASGVSNVNFTKHDITSISLTPGRWMVSGHCTTNASAATATVLRAGVSIVSATMPALDYDIGFSDPGWSVTTGRNETVFAPAVYLNLVSATTVYLVAINSFTAGSMTTWGKITAVRI